MDRKEQFLKYIDNELPEGERKEVEKLLASDPEAIEQMEHIKTNREALLMALEALNPDEPVSIPDFIKYRTQRRFLSTPLRIAAAIVILIGVSLALWMVSLNHTKEEGDAHLAVVTEIQQNYEDLDCYISPNRCWNERKIPLIIIKIK